MIFASIIYFLEQYRFKELNLFKNIHINMIKKLFFTLFLVLSQLVVLSQNIGDYRSAVTSGDWTVLASWQYYNGSAWVTPSGTSPQGYPGQYLGTGAVLIQSGNNINIPAPSTGTTGLSTQLMGTLTITGTLILNGTSASIDFIFNTQTIIVTPSAGSIFLNNKVNLKLPTNVTVQVSTGGISGDCSNNQDIYIGSSVYAYCTGGGSTSIKFTDIMSAGGTLNAVPSSNSPVCQGNPIILSGSVTGLSGAALAYNWSITDSNGNVTTTSTQNPIISNAITGTYTITLTCTTTYNSNVYSNSETISVVVNANLPASVSIAALPSGAICAGTSVTFTATSTNGGTTPTYQWYNGATAIGGATAATYTTTTLANGDVIKVIMTSNATPCLTGSPATSNTIVNEQPTKTWNGSSWSPSSPTSTDMIVFAGNYNTTEHPVSTDVVVCSCQVTSGTVTIASGNTMTLTNELTVSGGSLTFENNASLVQINDNANTGNITYKRITTPIRKFDYTYWSSPVADYTLGGVSPNTSLFYSFDAAINNWTQKSSATVMSNGIGYIARGPQNYDSVTAATFPAVFVGVPNNGAFSLTGIIANKMYLLGNPYPSALDADKFLMGNSSVLDGTIYFWTHNTAIGIGVSNPGTGVYAYSSDDYASYNLTGGVSTKTGNTVGGVEQTSNKPSGKIASGQAFFTSSKAAGTIAFNNNMRVGVGNNSQFFKITSSKTTKAIEKHRIWLNLTNAQGAFKQTLVGYVTSASNEYDNSFDGESFDGNKFIDFYSVVKDKNLTIQGRALPFDENDEVPLGYSSSIKGVFSIAIDQIDGLLVSQDVFIEDKSTNIVQNLKQGAYSFSTEVGTFKNRFVLRYTNANTDKTLGTDTFETLETSVYISKDKNELKITSELENIKTITVFDLLGKKVFDKEAINNKEFLISNIDLSKQAVIVKVTLANGQLISKKVIY